jgi:hypothetical protein
VLAQRQTLPRGNLTPFRAGGLLRLPPSTLPPSSTMATQRVGSALRCALQRRCSLVLRETRLHRTGGLPRLFSLASSPPPVSCGVPLPSFIPARRATRFASTVCGCWRGRACNRGGVRCVATAGTVVPAALVSSRGFFGFGNAPPLPAQQEVPWYAAAHGFGFICRARPTARHSWPPGWLLSRPRLCRYKRDAVDDYDEQNQPISAEERQERVAMTDEVRALCRPAERFAVWARPSNCQPLRRRGHTDSRLP